MGRLVISSSILFFEKKISQSIAYIKNSLYLCGVETNKILLNMKYYTRNYWNCFSSTILSRKDKRAFCSVLADAANNVKNTNIKLVRIDDASTELKVLSDGILLGVIFLTTDHMLIQPIGKIEVVFVDMFGKTHTIKSVKPNDILIISNEEIAYFVINIFELYVKSLSATDYNIY